MARLVLESSNGRVDQHPDVQELGRRVTQLAEAVETALKDIPTKQPTSADGAPL
jgi:hypothetical protein